MTSGSEPQAPASAPAAPERLAEPAFAAPAPGGALEPRLASVLALQRSAGNAAVSRMLAGRAGTPPARELAREPETKPELSDAEARAQKIKDAFHESSWSEDEEAALAQIRGQSPEMIRAIIGVYARIQGGRTLIEEFKDYVSTAQFAEAMTWLGPAVSLTDRIKAADGNKHVILDEIEHASPTERQLAGSDTAVIDLLRDTLDSGQLFTARKQLLPGITPDQLYALVVERIQGAKGFWNDDEGGVATALLELTPALRQRYWTDHSKDLGFLSADERASVEKICTGSEAEALTQSMKLATEGAGTDDDAVKTIVSSAASSRGEQARVDAALASGQNADGTPLSAEQRAQLEARRRELGDVGGLTAPKRSESSGEIDESSFLGMLHDDVSAGELQSFAGQIGVSEYEQAKQQILDAIGTLEDDEASVYKAFDRVHATLTAEELALPEAQRTALQRTKDAELRKQLKDDPAVARALLSLGADELKIVDAHVGGDPYELAILDLTDAYEGIDTDEERIFKLICGMSAADRARFKREQPPIYGKLTTPSMFMTAEEVGLVNDAIDTGHIPTDKALKWALDGLGTEDEMLAQTFSAMTQEEREEYRLGYFLWKGHTLPTAGEAEKTRQAEAKRKFTELYDRLAGGTVAELGTDDLQKALDQLLGLPGLDELKSEQGRRIAVEIWHDRIREKSKIRDDSVVSSTIVDTVSDTGEVQDVAGARFESAYRAALADDKLSEEEFAVLASLAKEFDERYAEHVAAVDEAAKIAGTVAAIAVAIVVTFATGGTAGPAAASLLAEYGATALTAGVASAATKVAVSETVGGSHYDTASTEGLTDAVTGFADGAMAVLSAGLAARFTSLVGLSKTALAAEMTAGVVEASGSALAQGARASGVGALKAGIEGFLAGVVGEVVMTTLDAETWKKRVFEVIEAYGAAILRGGLMGAVTGAAVGGPLEALTTYVGISRFQTLVTELESRGLAKARLSTLTVRAVRGIGQADSLIGKDVAAARKALLDLEGELKPDELEGIWKALGDHHQPGKDLGPLKPPSADGTGGDHGGGGGGGGGKDGDPPSHDDPPGPKRDPKKDAEALKAAIEALKAKHGGHSFEPVGEYVRINGQIDVHPGTLDRLPPNSVDDILVASKALADGADPTKLSGAIKEAYDRVALTSGLRFRFRFQLEGQVDAFVERLGVKGRPPFDGTLDEAQRARLFEAANAKKEFGALRDSAEKQAAEYALLQHPSSATDWVDHFELYKEFLRRRVAALEEEFQKAVDEAMAAAGKTTKDKAFFDATKKKISKDMFGKELTTNKEIADAIDEKAVKGAGSAADVNQPSDALRAEVEAAYKKNAAALEGKLGTATIPPDLEGEPLYDAIRKADPKFASEPAAVYHPEKHGDRLPALENRPESARTGNTVDDYLALAKDAVAHGEPTTAPSQFGGRVVKFTIKYPGEKAARGAFVLVKDDGTVLILSYF